MIQNSIRLRILLTTLLSGGVALVLVGLVILITFETYIERRFNDQLNATMTDIIAASETINGQTINLRWESGNTAFKAPLSGWYWLIHNNDGKTLLNSDSFLGLSADWLTKALQSRTAGSRYIQITDPTGKEIRVLVREITLSEESQPIIFIVTGPQDSVSNDVTGFAEILAISLAVVAIAFIGILLYQIHSVLKPLSLARLEVSEIREGTKKLLSENYPVEILPLANEINALLNDNETIISRARLQASNLAHAIKNPLSVLRNDHSGEQGLKVRNQIDKLSATINRYLSRVRIAAATDTSRKITVAYDVLDDLIYSMKQIHRSKQIQINLQCEKNIIFKGDQQDFEEVLGNLIDNACKWADSVVDVIVSIDTTSLIIRIKDDGDGIDQEMLANAFKPGQRLDETVSGHGLGLSIATDIVESYGGKINVLTNTDRGADICVNLPGSISKSNKKANESTTI